MTNKGHLYTSGNIGEALAIRNLNEELRLAGVLGAGGPAPMVGKDRSKFLAKLDEAMNATKRQFPSVG